MSGKALNKAVIPFASAARTTSGEIDSIDFVNTDWKGVEVLINCSVKGGAAPSVVFTVQGKDEVSGNYFDMLASAAIVAVGLTRLVIYPGITAAANLSLSNFLPYIFRIKAVAANTDSITYSVSATLLR